MKLVNFDFQARKQNRGFTLIELLVSIAIVALLAVLIVSAIGSVSIRSKQIRSLANMRTITSGLLAFGSENQMQLPSNDNDRELAWDTRILPYLGFSSDADDENGRVGPVRIGSIALANLFRCPLDTRKPNPSAGFFPRSYGITGAAINNAGEWNGGMDQPRGSGEGMLLVRIQNPSKFVLLCRSPRNWEHSGNVIGGIGWNANNGPPPTNPNDDHWDIFQGKTPYGFADGHVAFLTPEEAREVDPNDWASES